MGYGSRKRRTGEQECNPLVLAWDTCTKRGTLVLGDRERVWAESYFMTIKGHSGWLMPTLDATMANFGMGPSDIDVLAVGVGPGTFTGVKVGVTCAKAIAEALGIPLVGISTLDILAAGAAGCGEAVLSCIDARREMAYAAAYRLEGTTPMLISGYTCLSEAEFAEWIRPLGLGNLVLVGFEPTWMDRALESLGLVARRVGDEHPVGRQLLGIALEIIEEGRFQKTGAVMPVYLRKPT